jgi:hypothetical protein
LFLIILKIQQIKLCPWGLGAGVCFSNLWFESLAKLSKNFAFGSNLHFFFKNVQVSFPHSAKIHPMFLQNLVGSKSRRLKIIYLSTPSALEQIICDILIFQKYSKIFFSQRIFL